MRRLLAVALALLVTAVGVGFVTWRSTIATTPGVTPSPTAAPRLPQPRDVVAEGRAIPLRTAVLGTRVPGTLTAIVELGAQVAEGDPLITLDSAAADAQLAGAQAALDAATFQLDQANATVTQADAGIATAQAGVDQAQAGVDQAQAGVDQARAGVDQATAGLEQARAGVAEAQAARDLLPGAATTAQKSQADAVVNGTQAAVNVANAALDQSNAGVSGAVAALAGAQAGLARAQAQVQSAGAARTFAEAAAGLASAGRDQAEAAVNSARVARSQYTVKAPFAGTVASVLLHVGEGVSPGVPIVWLADLSTWTFETTDLVGADAARIAPGDIATVTVEDLAGLEIPGYILTVADFGEDRLGDVAFRVVIVPTRPVPLAIKWNTVVTVTIHPDTAARGQGATP